MIDENKKCKEYLDYPVLLVKYVAEKLSIPFNSIRIWSGMTYYARFIPDPECIFNPFTNSFVYEPFSRKFTVNCPNYTVNYTDRTIKEVIDKIIELIKEYQQYTKQRHIDAVIGAAASFEAQYGNIK